MPLLRAYQHLVFERPRLVLVIVAFLTILAIFYSSQFELDASGESLVLENDASLNYYREIREDYGTDEFLVITYAPYTDLLSAKSLFTNSETALSRESPTSSTARRSRVFQAFKMKAT